MSPLKEFNPSVVEAGDTKHPANRVLLNSLAETVHSGVIPAKGASTYTLTYNDANTCFPQYIFNRLTSVYLKKKSKLAFVISCPKKY